MRIEGSMEMVPRRYAGSCSEEEIPSWKQSANWTLNKPLRKSLLVLQVGKFRLPQLPLNIHTYTNEKIKFQFLQWSGYGMCETPEMW